MPCAGCHLQFTVFRRKRLCGDCKRFFCSNCLSVESPKKSPAQLIQSSSLCARCAIFAKRPLLHNDLQHLKPKDLIFYLQSKHISTAGCVEKDELIRLVLNHIQEIDASTSGSADRSSSSTPFRNIKQSCQNFFNNITENLHETFSAFDETNVKTSNDRKPKSPTKSANDDIKVGTRVLPSYASMQRNEYSPSSSNHSNDEQYNNNNNNRGSTSNTPNNIPNTPVVSPTAHLNNTTDRFCFCSEDEENEKKEDKSKPEPETNLKITIGNGSDENSSHSSFEELGAIGGLSDEIKTPADSNSGNSSNMDAWHIFDACPTTSNMSQHLSGVTEAEEQAKPAHNQNDAENSTSARKKLLRHHSESYLQLKRKAQQSLEEDEPPTSSASKQRLCCKRCGKQKSSLKQHVDNIRRLLEDAQMSEADIKQELQELFSYLNSAGDDDNMSIRSGPNTSLQNVDSAFYDENAGIHVYGMPADEDNHNDNKSAQRRFINLTDYDSLNELETLSVKQLKEILMLNRVDYKGCVEKQELLERVQRLWLNLKSTPGKINA